MPASSRVPAARLAMGVVAALLAVACAPRPTSMRVLLSSPTAVFVERTGGGANVGVFRCAADGTDCEASDLPAVILATRSETRRELALSEAGPDRAREQPTSPGADDGRWAELLTAPARSASTAQGEERPQEGCEACGWISLASYPYCALRVDGEQAGVTPVRRLLLPPGAHRLECQTQSGDSEEFGVVVREGEHERLVIAVQE